MCVLVVSLLMTNTAPVFLFILVIGSFISELKSPFSLEQTVVPDITLVKVNLSLYLRNTARV